MKKSIIKRRKRVVPASQESPESEGATRSDVTEHRGSTNTDGSVNLGFRPRLEPRILPEPLNTLRNRETPPGPTDLTAYSSHHQSHQNNISSLTSANRLPPMASYPSPTQRHPSLSPSSFLSPSRKRSFTAADNEAQSQHGDSNSKRISSIKSILNPAQHSDDNEQGSLDPSLRASGQRYSPNRTYTPGPVMSDSERQRMDRKKTELRREAENMRALLAAKERELEDLD